MARPEGYSFTPFDIPLEGKLITSDDPILLKRGDFCVLKNLRPSDRGLAGIGGMTKINAAAADYLVVQNGTHFRKDDVSETHVIVQTTSGASSRLIKSDNTSSIPAQDTFTNWLTLDNNNRAYFSSSPDSSVMFMNGEKNYIWGGSEARCPKFLTASAALTTATPTNPVDYTEAVNNSLTDAGNVAIIGGGNDAYAKLLLHGGGADTSTTITDSSSGAKACVANGSCQIDTAYAKFGTGSILFDGAGDYVSTADHADWNFSTGTLTIDGWVRFAAVTGMYCLYSQAVAATYVILFYDGARDKLIFTVLSASTRIAYQEISWSPSANTWYHLAVIRGWGGAANGWAITVDGAAIWSATDSITMPDVGAELWLGLNSTAIPIDQGYVGVSLTPVNGPTIGAAGSKLGYGCLTFTAASNHYVQTNTTGQIDPGSTDFTIEMFVKFTSLPAGGGMYLINKGSTAANNYSYSVALTENAGTYYLRAWYSVDGTATKGGAGTNLDQAVTVSTGVWYHVAFRRSTTSMQLYLDGVALGSAFNCGTDTVYLNSGIATVLGSYVGPASLLNGAIEEVRWSNTARTVTVPTTPYTYDANTKMLVHCHYLAMNGWLDEVRISKGVARWTAAFTPNTREYSTASLVWLVGAIRPIQGIKVYMGDVNSGANTLSAKEWNGYSWSTLTVTADGTRNVGDTASLTKTGSITFSSTESTSKPIPILENMAYWYQFAVTAGEATIYRVTLDMAPQPIMDIWDGNYRTCYSMFKYTTAYTDYTTNVYKSEYVASDTTTFAQLGGLAAFSTPNNCVFLGFSDRMTGLRIVIPDATYRNATAATTMSIDYWDGYAWASVGDLQDGSSSGAISMSQTGTVTWNAKAINQEFMTSVGNGTQFYYYRLRWDKELDDGAAGNDVRVDTIVGIPAQISINPRRFSCLWQNRLWLFDEVDGSRNTGICSQLGTSCVFNGTNTAELEFGGPTRVLAADTLFTRYGGGLYDNMIVFKESQVFLVDGSVPADFRVYEVSSEVGIVAPLTLKRCDVSYESAPGITKHVLIWRSTSGIEMFDGNAIATISDDIGDLFDPLSSTYITPATTESAFYDPVRKEYHWLTAAAEWVFGLIKKKWWQADRGTKYLQCGWPVADSSGIKYMFGGLSTGYIERLEYGTSMDGTAITYTFRTGDFPLTSSIMYVTLIRYLKLVGIVKSTTTSTITVTHFADGSTTGVALKTISQNVSGKRVFQTVLSTSKEAVFHSLQFSISTSNETIGFEPLFLSGLAQTVREDFK